MKKFYKKLYTYYNQKDTNDKYVHIPKSIDEIEHYGRVYIRKTSDWLSNNEKHSCKKIFKIFGEKKPLFPKYLEDILKNG